jgi:nitroreductase
VVGDAQVTLEPHHSRIGSPHTNTVLAPSGRTHLVLHIGSISPRDVCNPTDSCQADDMIEPATFDQLSAVVRGRRTSMLVDQECEVPTALIEQLCELASWAPNHKKTWPCKFAAFSGDGRKRLGETMVADMTEADFGDEIKREKTAGKYLRTPTTLVVGCEAHENRMLHDENRDAVSAGIQNLLLGATSLGLASFWSTPALSQPPRVLELCEFDATDRVVGLIYLGWAKSFAPVPERPPARLIHIDS